MPAGCIRITHVPSGEAPQWVREKWAGLVLPVATWRSKPRMAYTSGVLSGPPNRLAAIWWGLRGRLERQSGYAVDASAALAILERTAPDAASWWRANVPRLLARGRRFMFRTSDCELVAGR